MSAKRGITVDDFAEALANAAPNLTYTQVGKRLGLSVYATEAYWMQILARLGAQAR